MEKTIAVLGSTGSIGTQTLEVVRENGDIRVAALAAGRNIDLLEKQIREFSPLLAAVWEEEERQFAYTEKDPKTGKLSGRVEIQIGDSDGEQVEILEGLEEGSVVYYSEG